MTNRVPFPRRFRFNSWLPIIWLPVLGLFIFLLIRNAWICDDILITMRSVDNLVNGYGFVYNAGERVQTFTHPLWALMLSGIYYFTREAYFSVLIPAMVLSTVTVILLSLTARKLHIGVICLLIVCFSKSFMDYSTSGLENPMTFLLLALFFLYTQRDKDPLQDRAWIKLGMVSLIAGLAAFNRMDTLVFFLPYLGWEFFKDPRWKNLKYIIYGFLPFIAWEIFSVIYYGFPFPNTAYAKLNTGIAKMDLILQGFSYLKESFLHDPITLIFIFLSIISVVPRDRSAFRPYAIGIILYVAYTVWVGGDFMSGRFLAAPFLLSMFILSRLKFRAVFAGPFLAGTILTGLLMPLSPIRADGQYHLNNPDRGVPGNGIVDEKRFYYEKLGLLSDNRVEQLISPHEKREIPEEIPVPNVIITYGMGYWAYFYGPEKHYVDYYALSDALLARLPCRNPVAWRIGHFEREIPNGYPRSLVDGLNLIEDQQLATFYDHLSVVIKEDIFTMNRFREIFRMNTGQYNHLIVKDRYRNLSRWKRKVSLPQLRVKKKDGTPLNAFDVTAIDPDAGIEVDLLRPLYKNKMSFSLSGDSDFILGLNLGSQLLQEWSVETTDSSFAGLKNYEFEIPDSVRKSGYDRLLIRTTESDSSARIGHLLFN